MKSDALLKTISTMKNANQKQKALPNQVKNNAGGYVFKLEPMAQLRRFLVLGTTGGTYYQGEQEISNDAVEMVLTLMQDKQKGLEAIFEAVKVSSGNLAPKNNPALFVVAAGVTSPDMLTKMTAYRALPKVARTFTHLAIWLNYVGKLKGTYAGMGLRKALQRWYLEKSPAQVAYQMVKYRQRDGWTHRDVLRLAKPTPQTDDYQAVLAFATNKMPKAVTTKVLVANYHYEIPKILQGFLQVQEHGENLNGKQAVDLISEYDLPWEALPDHVKNDPTVWSALLPKMGAIALLRQLPTLTRVGVLRPGTKSAALVVSKLTDQEFLTKGRVHPFNILMAQKVYASGKSMAGSSTWSPVLDIIDALDQAFYLAFGAVQPSGVRVQLCLDVSKSMSQHVVSSGAKDKYGRPVPSPLNAREASCAMALVNLAVEEDVQLVGFTGAGSGGRYGWGRYGDSKLTPIEIARGMSLQDAVGKVTGLPFGRTDCSLPMVTALENKQVFDLFVIYTDNETWAGKVHPYKALEDYRKALNPQAKLAVVALTASPFSIANPDDPGMLDVVGFDTSAPNLISSFARGEF